ncbi:MAG TPA: cytochrome c [Terriglobales bacterium]|nr:cytochrome c [Terriglobales bacterium]
MNSFRHHPVLLVALLLSFALALTVAIAQTRIGSYSPENLGKITQPAPQVLSENSLYETASYPAFGLDLAPGEGRAEVQIYCNTCHTPRYILMQPPLPAATWDAEVHKMIKTLGAPIPDADAQKIIQYLQTHYTPEIRK